MLISHVTQADRPAQWKSQTYSIDIVTESNKMIADDKDRLILQKESIVRRQV
jgi:hypothetical protein